jgi:hypothetical protein
VTVGAGTPAPVGADRFEQLGVAPRSWNAGPGTAFALHRQPSMKVLVCRSGSCTPSTFAAAFAARGGVLCRVRSHPLPRVLHIAACGVAPATSMSAFDHHWRANV